ncbi:MAG: EAL domain-containing protein [Halioglobus sp.]
MSISVRFSLLFTLAIMLMGIIAALATASREYGIQLAGVTDRAESQLLSHPDLQYAIYSADAERLQTRLADFLKDEASASAKAYNGLGELLASVDRPGANTFTSASFTLIRGSLMTGDPGLLSFDSGNGAPQSTGFGTALFDAAAPIYQTLPVFTEVNTGRAGLDAADFAIAMTSKPSTSSQRVIGYVHVLFDPSVLRSDALGAGIRVFLINVVLALICGAIAWTFTHRVTRPLRELADIADSVASGEIKDPIKVEGSGEIQEIARLFNSVIEGLSDSKKVHEVDKRLLSLKVEERSSQLSKRDVELTKVVEEANEARNRAHHLANYDNLTSLPNRRLLTEQLELLLKLNQRNGHTLALLFIDLDDFKRINDSLGISAGDQLLVEMSRRLSDTVRDSDLVGRFASNNTEIDVARLGADEFTVILNQLDSPDSARLVAARLVQQITAPLSIEGHDLVLQPSVGIAIAPNDGKDVESLLKAASIAKFHAKQNDGAQIELYRNNMGQEGEERIRLESDLRKAVETNALTLHYQPQIDTHSGSVLGAEALLRWEHPELGPIAPGRFVALAEEIGLMEELGDWVLVQACQQLRSFSDEGIKLAKVAINVSAEQFTPDFVRRVGEVIDETGIEANQLELGLTEAVMSSNDPDTVAALKILKESGVYLSVDDFGTGYSPINYLSQYPLDELKIDRSFLLEAEKSKNGANLVIAIIAMAKSLELRVLASGVETEAQFHFLTSNGASLIQGYLFSKPVPVDELKPMLAPWHFVDKVQKLANSAPGATGASLI